MSKENINIKPLGETLKDGIIRVEDVEREIHCPRIISWFKVYIGEISYDELLKVNIRNPKFLSSVDIDCHYLLEIITTFTETMVDIDTGKYVDTDKRKYSYTGNTLTKIEIEYPDKDVKCTNIILNEDDSKEYSKHIINHFSDADGIFCEEDIRVMKYRTKIVSYDNGKTSVGEYDNTTKLLLSTELTYDDSSYDMWCTDYQYADDVLVKKLETICRSDKDNIEREEEVETPFSVFEQEKQRVKELLETR